MKFLIVMLFVFCTLLAAVFSLPTNENVANDPWTVVLSRTKREAKACDGNSGNIASNSGQTTTRAPLPQPPIRGL
uniref:CSON003777 protein n=1 Tax=Culicoides sonorensis TaxID=179676 RepID=A0A336KHV5_CULSO